MAEVKVCSFEVELEVGPRFFGLGAVAPGAAAVLHAIGALTMVYPILTSWVSV